MENQKPVSLLQKFVSGELHFGLWGIVGRGIGWVNSFFIISALTVYQYGVFQLFLATYAVFMEFVSWGGLAVGTDILRFVGRGQEARAKRLFSEYNVLRLATALTLWALFFFGAPVIASFSSPELIGPIRIMSFMLLAELALAAVTTLVNLRMDFKALASRRAVGKSFQLAILIGFFLFSTVGLTEILLALVVGHALSTVLLLPAAVRAWRPWRSVAAARGPFILWRVARAHGKWESIKNIASQFASRVQPWLINLFISTEAVGIYGVAASLAEVVMQATPRNTMNVLIALVFYDTERARRLFTYTVKYLVLWGCAGVVGSWIAVPVVITALLPQYAAALPFFSLLVTLVPLKSFQWIMDLFLRVLRQQKFAFLRMVSRNATVFVLLLLLLPVIGLWALPLTEIIVRMSIVYVSYRHLLKLRPEFRISLRLFFSFGPEDRNVFKDVIANVKLFVRRRAA